MIRRFEVDWPDPRPFAGRASPIRFLAVSDMAEPSLEREAGRASGGAIDGGLGWGGLPPAWLSCLGDAVRVPIVYVRGNHDRTGAWADGSVVVPDWLGPGAMARLAGSTGGRPERAG